MVVMINGKKAREEGGGGAKGESIVRNTKK